MGSCRDIEFRKARGQHPVIVFVGCPTRLRPITLILMISVFARLRDRLQTQVDAACNGTSFNTILETVICHYQHEHTTGDANLETILLRQNIILFTSDET